MSEFILTIYTAIVLRAYHSDDHVEAARKIRDRLKSRMDIIRSCLNSQAKVWRDDPGRWFEIMAESFKKHGFFSNLEKLPLAELLKSSWNAIQSCPPVSPGCVVAIWPEDLLPPEPSCWAADGDGCEHSEDDEIEEVDDDDDDDESDDDEKAVDLDDEYEE
jgi:hypothetical protein